MRLRPLASTDRLDFVYCERFGGSPAMDSLKPGTDLVEALDFVIAQLDSDRADDWRGQGSFAHLLVGDPASPDDYDDDQGVRTYSTRIYLGGD